MKFAYRALGLGLLSGSLVLGLAAGLPAVAAKAKRVRRTVPLFPTLAGQQARLKGKVRLDIRPAEGREKINVEAESTALPAGTVLDVWVVNPTNSPDPVKLGELTLAPNPRRPSEVEDELEAKNYDEQSLPTGVEPSAGITRYLVTTHDDVNAVLLTNVNPGGNPPGGGGGTVTPFKRTVSLAPTPAGAAAKAKGKSTLEIGKDGRERFKIEVEADKLPAGTVLTLEFSTDTLTNQPAGTLTLVEQNGEVEGEVEFDSAEGPALPAGASPVNKIQSVVVKLDNEVLLTGTF